MEQIIILLVMLLMGSQQVAVPPAALPVQSETRHLYDVLQYGDARLGQWRVSAAQDNSTFTEASWVNDNIQAVIQIIDTVQRQPLDPNEVYDDAFFQDKMRNY